MKVIDCPESSDVITFNDKVMGVMENQTNLNRFLQAVDRLGSDEVEILAGSAGIRCLQSVKRSVEGFLDAVLGDMESSMMAVYLRAIESGSVVFAVPCHADKRDSIVEVAVESGARHVAHFGQMVNESFQHRRGDLPP